ncbi:MAG: 4a-hydroxytetrahydrobiopterin dehydratase [Chloroflexota bacterium]
MKREKLTVEQINQALASLSGWDYQDGKLTKQFKFKSFAKALGWMVSVGVEADKMDHHPEWSNVYSRVTVNLTTHDMDNSVSSLDVSLAKIMDETARV